jgi:hypothetical protein
MSTFLKSILIENISLPSIVAKPIHKGDIIEVKDDAVAAKLLTRSQFHAASPEDTPEEKFYWEKSTAKEFKAQEDAKAEAKAALAPNVRTEPVKADTKEHLNEPEGTHPPKAAAVEEPKGDESGDIRMTDLSKDGAGKPEETATEAPAEAKAPVKAPAKAKAPAAKPAEAKPAAKAPVRRAAPVQRKSK